MLTKDRIKVCHLCPHRAKPIAGKSPCNADPEKRDMLWHAEHDDCPVGNFAAVAGLSEASAVDEILDSLPVLPPTWANVQAGWRRQLDFQLHVFHDPPPTPAHHRGIVIGGGGKYLPSVYVTASILRRVHTSNLPIEVWHIGSEEMLPWQRDALVALGNLTTRDARDFAPIRHGYELKSLAITHCDFAEVMFLDADSFPVHSPDDFFTMDGKLAESGAVFSKDQAKFDLTVAQCELLGFRFTGEAGIETGQFLLDRQRRWQSICLWRWLDSNSRYYYRHGLGDCLTANGAFNLTGGFSWASERRWAFESPAVLQHWQDRVAFVHRINGKFSVGANGFYSVQNNQRNDAIPLEPQAWEFFAEYRDLAARYPTPKPCCGKQEVVQTLGPEPGWLTVA